MMRRHFIPVLTGGILALLLAGGLGAPELRAAAAGDTLRKGVPIPPPTAPTGGSGVPLAKPPIAAAPQPAAGYEYNAARKADPFKPFMETEPAPKMKKTEDPKKKTDVLGASISPLQRLDIGQFRLVGISGDQKRCVAIVEDGVSKRYYPLFVGTFIGLNGGRVAAILPDRVIVEERAGQQTKKEKAKIRRVTVMLRKEEEGKP